MSAGDIGALVVAVLALATVIWQGGRMAAVLEGLVQVVKGLDDRQRADHDEITRLRAASPGDGKLRQLQGGAPRHPRG